MQALVAVFFCIVVGIFGAPARSHDVESSSSDLICHTSDPAECYPRIFQPTKEFQPVRDDQQLPKGLHVRLNIWTGQKEAKINVPGDNDSSLEGLAVDKAVVIVDPEPGAAGQTAPKIPKGAPAYEAVGKVKEPEHESGAFYDGLQMVKKGVSGSDEAFDKALDGLEDLSHDLYYGLKIAEDADAVKSLFCLMTHPQVPVVEGAVPRDQQAAAILAGTLSNNPKALREVAKVWSQLDGFQCPGGVVKVEAGAREGKGRGSLQQALFDSVSPATAGGTTATAAARSRSKVAVINGLIRDASIRADFLRGDGMVALLKVLQPRGKEWASAQRKVGQLVLDNFLDEDMGAVLGQWPRVSPLAGEQCEGQAAEAAPQEGCWDHHIARIVKASSKTDGWSRDLKDRLAAVRRKQKKEGDHGEL